MHIEFYRYLVQVQNRFMTNFYTIIKGEFGTFYARNKGVTHAYSKNPCSFMLRYTSPYIVRFYSSKNTLPFKVYLDLADVKTIYKENNRKSGIYR